MRKTNKIVGQFTGLALAASLCLSAVGSLAAAADEHDTGAHDTGAHDTGAHAAGGHEAGGHEFNWIYGFLGESDEIEHPTVLFRTPGMPVPFVAYLINTSLLFFLLYKMGKGPLVAGLKSRRERIMQGMDQAAKMKEEASAQLAEHQAKLDSIETEIARIKSAMREAAEQERQAILTEAKGRKERMRRDAQKLLSQERKAAQEALIQEMACSAAESARALLSAEVTAADHQRLSDDYLNNLEGLLRGAGGLS